MELYSQHGSGLSGGDKILLKKNIQASLEEMVKVKTLNIVDELDLTYRTVALHGSINDKSFNLRMFEKAYSEIKIN